MGGFSPRTNTHKTTRGNKTSQEPQTSPHWDELGGSGLQSLKRKLKTPQSFTSLSVELTQLLVTELNPFPSKNYPDDLEPDLKPAIKCCRFVKKTLCVFLWSSICSGLTPLAQFPRRADHSSRQEGVNSAPLWVAAAQLASSSIRPNYRRQLSQAGLWHYQSQISSAPEPGQIMGVREFPSLKNKPRVPHRPLYWIFKLPKSWDGIFGSFW